MPAGILSQNISRQPGQGPSSENWIRPRSRYPVWLNGWSMGHATSIVNNFTETMRKYPNIPTIPASAALGSDLPEFVVPNWVSPLERTDEFAFRIWYAWSAASDGGLERLGKYRGQRLRANR
jgi:hypothetical protein